MTEPLADISSDQPASRPGLKTLVITMVLIMLVIGIKFSDSLMSLLSHGR